MTTNEALEIKYSTIKVTGAAIRMWTYQEGGENFFEAYDVGKATVALLRAFKETHESRCLLNHEGDWSNCEYASYFFLEDFWITSDSIVIHDVDLNDAKIIDNDDAMKR